jgi:hypothetical protein
MPIPITVNYITYPSHIAYYHTREDHGDCTYHCYYMYMKLKHDPEFRERQKHLAIKRTMIRYNTDPVFKEKINKRRMELYRKKQDCELSKSLLISPNSENVVTFN